MTVASMISPASTGSLSTSTFRSPRVVSRTMVRVSSAGTVIDFSLFRKSCSPMVGNAVLEAAPQGVLTRECLVHAGVLAHVGLDQERGPPVGVALAQHRVDHGTDGLAVFGADLGLLR